MSRLLLILATSLAATSFLQAASENSTSDWQDEVDEVCAVLEIRSDSKGAARSSLRNYVLVEKVPPPVEQRRRVREFASLLTTDGMNPAELAEISVEGLTVAGKRMGTGFLTDPKARRESAHVSIIPILVSELKGEDDAAQARVISRALLFIAAFEPIRGTSYLPHFCSDARYANVLQKAELSDNQISILTKFAEKSRSERRTSMKYLRTNSRALDAMIRSNGNEPEWTKNASTFIESLDAGVVSQPRQLNAQLDFLTHAWQAKCLANAVGRDEFVENLKATLQSMQNRSSCQVTKRWIVEVIELPGDKPKAPYHRFIDDPNQIKKGLPE